MMLAVSCEMKEYSTQDVVKIVRISRNTLYKWFKKGYIEEVQKDRNGFRIFTQDDVDRILAYKNKRVQPDRVQGVLF